VNAESPRPVPLTDSPWFWLLLFATAALAALSVIGPKHLWRQARIERMQHARDVSRQSVGAPGQVPVGPVPPPLRADDQGQNAMPLEPKDPASLRLLAMLLVGMIGVATVGCARHVQRQRKGQRSWTQAKSAEE